MTILSPYARYLLPARLLYIIARIFYLANYVLASLCLLLTFNTNAQLANSNFGLRGKVGLTLNHELSSGGYEHFQFRQNNTNLQADLPLFLKIDSSGTKTKVHYLKATYTFRKTTNAFNQTENFQNNIPRTFYANGLTLNYLHTISYPWMFNHNLRVVYAGDYGDYNPVHINTTFLLLYKWNKNLVIGAGVSYQTNGFDDDRYIFVPFIDWRSQKGWFVDLTSPNRLLIGKNLGKHQTTQIALGTYLEFLTRHSFKVENQKMLFDQFELAAGIDFRTQIHGKCYFNAFIGNNFYKNITIENNDFKKIEEHKSHWGLNARIGLSLNLQE